MLRVIAILLLIFIIVNLFWGLYTMLRSGSSANEDRTRVVRILTLRVAVSIILFALLMLSIGLGWW